MNEEDNNDKARAIIESAFPHLWMLKEAMDRADILEVDVLRALFLVENIRKVSRYGKVTITVKDGEVVGINGETVFISERELMRNLKAKQGK